MEMFGPKIEIVNHFDNLIQQVNIEFEECLKRYNENQVLEELECFKVENRKIERNFLFLVYFCKSTSEKKERTEEIWPESTKVVDYLSQVRMRSIEELRKAQEWTLDNYKLNSSAFNFNTVELTNEEKKCQLFADKFYFQVKLSKSKWVFNLFTFVTDFYISSSDIDLLEKFINAKETDKYFFSRHSKHVFDEKIVLIGRLYEIFRAHLNHLKWPIQMIYVSKQHILKKIERIDFNYSVSGVNLTNLSIDLPKLSRLNIRIDSLSCIDNIVIENLPSLESLSLILDSTESLNDLKDITTDLFDNVPNIEIVYHDKKLKTIFYFEKLKKSITIYERGGKEFICDILVKNLANRIEELCVFYGSIEYITRLFNKYVFENLKELSLVECDITNRIEKEFIYAFPQMIQLLNISDCKNLREIDHDAFSNLKQLKILSLCHNSIESIERRHFSNLINLETLAVCDRLKRLDGNLFVDLKNLKNLDLSWNKLKNFDSKAFFLLENLEELDLSFNKIEKIDHEAFSNLKRLVSLDLSCNRIESLDKRHFSDLINLESLDLGNNRLKQLDENLFSDLKNLKHLCLDTNGFDLENLDAKVFAGLENLNELNLSRNHLIPCNPNLFSYLKNLKKLYLESSWNLNVNSEPLDFRFFVGLENLNELGFSCYDLSRFDFRILDNLPRIETVCLYGNRIENIDTEVLKPFKESHINFIFFA